MWTKTSLGNHIRLVVNGEASELITITWRLAHDNTISPLTFAVVKEVVAKWIAQESNRYVITGIEAKGMDHMDDKIRIADSVEEIRKITTIQSKFAEWA